MKKKNELCVIPDVVKSVEIRTQQSPPDPKGSIAIFRSVLIDGDPWHLTGVQQATLMQVAMQAALDHESDMSKVIKPETATAMVAALVAAMRGMRITRDPIDTDDDFTIEYS